MLKPDAAIYRRLLDQHGLSAEDTLFIDDVEWNVEGACAVGMHAARFLDAPTLRADLSAYGLLQDMPQQRSGTCLAGKD